jgi:hypothetical protein
MTPSFSPLPVMWTFEAEKELEAIRAYSVLLTLSPRSE